MTQEELVREYKRLIETETIDRSKASTYFKTGRKFYAPLQDGVADEFNFFDNTMVLYTETEDPGREPDFTSNSGSRYWYTENGVIRGSNHWGNRVANCDWALKRKNGRTVYGQSAWELQNFGRVFFGYADWKDFIQKAELYEINGREVLTTFNNHVGRDIVYVDDKPYRKVITISWEEADPEEVK